MALNVNYDAIGKAFTQQYYALFDDPGQRENLATFYNAEQSLMTFEGHQLQGSEKIMAKIRSLTFKKVIHFITAVDCQPTFDGGILINVLGRLQTDEDPPHSYTQTFVLKSMGGSWFVQHDIFRVALHNIGQCLLVHVTERDLDRGGEMHTPLEPHLHTSECNAIIEKLIACHRERSSFAQLFGACNELDRDMRRCTKNERLAREAEAKKESAERRQRIRERLSQAAKEGKDWKDMLEESYRRKNSSK